MNNRCLALVLLIVVGLLGSANVTAAEPTPSSDMPQDRPETPESWGDPEDGEAPDRGWTWFGMGYEKRMQATTGAAADAGGGAGSTSQQQGRHQSRGK